MSCDLIYTEKKTIKRNFYMSLVTSDVQFGAMTLYQSRGPRVFISPREFRQNTDSHLANLRHTFETLSHVEYALAKVSKYAIDGGCINDYEAVLVSKEN